MTEESGYIDLNVLQKVSTELRNAAEKHGPTFPSVGKGLRALLDEAGEAIEALENNDIDGAHGVRREITQVIAVGFKILQGLPAKGT